LRAYFSHAAPMSTYAPPLHGNWGSRKTMMLDGARRPSNKVKTMTRCLFFVAALRRFWSQKKPPRLANPSFARLLKLVMMLSWFLVGGAWQSGGTRCKNRAPMATTWLVGNLAFVSLLLGWVVFFSSFRWRPKATAPNCLLAGARWCSPRRFAITLLARR